MKKSRYIGDWVWSNCWIAALWIYVKKRHKVKRVVWVRLGIRPHPILVMKNGTCIHYRIKKHNMYVFGLGKVHMFPESRLK